MWSIDFFFFLQRCQRNSLRKGKSSKYGIGTIMEKINLNPFLIPCIEQNTFTKIVKILEENYRVYPNDLEVCTYFLEDKKNH